MNKEIFSFIEPKLSSYDGIGHKKRRRAYYPASFLILTGKRVFVALAEIKNNDSGIFFSKLIKNWGMKSKG